MSFPTQATMNKTTDLKELLAQIGLLALAECVEDFLARAAKGRPRPPSPATPSSSTPPSAGCPVWPPPTTPAASTPSSNAYAATG